MHREQDGTKRTDAFGTSTTEAASQTVAEFVDRNAIMDKWADHDWFIRLSSRVMRTGLGNECARRGKHMRSAFVQVRGKRVARS